MELSGDAAAEMANVAVLIDPRCDIERLRDHVRKKGKGVALLNFTKLRILNSRLLGQGSSAKVYEGRFNDMKCAIKGERSLDTTRKLNADRSIDQHFHTFSSSFPSRNNGG